MHERFFSVCGVAISVVSLAQSDVRPQILVLGTYHMANPGHDIHNMQVDDVLLPKRQQEIAQLIEVLKRFRPIKIACIFSREVVGILLRDLRAADIGFNG